MHPFLQNSIRLARSLSVIGTLMLTLVVTSTQGAFEECSEETVSQEIELVLGRREHRKTREIKQPNDIGCSLVRTPCTSDSATGELVIANSERSNLNGTGSYLLI